MSLAVAMVTQCRARPSEREAARAHYQPIVLPSGSHCGRTFCIMCNNLKHFFVTLVRIAGGIFTDPRWGSKYTRRCDL